jgi:CO/xanthine dehydrogenase FAD-binding subunit
MSSSSRAAFELHEPATLPEAVGLLGRFGAKGKIVAGGSDLVAGVMKD